MNTRLLFARFAAAITVHRHVLLEHLLSLGIVGCLLHARRRTKLPPVGQVAADGGQEDLDNVRRTLVLAVRVAELPDLVDDLLHRGQILGHLGHDVLALERLLAYIRPAVHDRVLVVHIVLGLEEGDGKGGGKRAEALANERAVAVQLAYDPFAVNELRARCAQRPQGHENLVRGQLNLASYLSKFELIKFLRVIFFSVKNGPFEK